MMKPRVELVYDSDCPNVTATRAALLQAFAQAGLPASWTEWNRKSPDSPESVRAYGSPTILVDGADVAGAEPGAGADHCRVYVDRENRFRGVPPVEGIAAALMTANHDAAPSGARATAPDGWRGLLGVLPGLAAALLPVGTCPACWPAYAAVLGSVGLGFLFTETYLLPLTAVFLALALAALAYRARSRRGYGPFGLGMAAAAIVLSGKFALSSTAPLYTGLVLLVGAALWNAWPHHVAPAGSCAACAPQGRRPRHRAHTREVLRDCKTEG